MEVGMLNRNSALNADILFNAYYQIIRSHLTAEERLIALEDALGAKLPAEYAAFLKLHRTEKRLDRVVATDSGYWDVHALFEFADGPIDVQVDRAYKVVCDVLPPSMLPIAEDSAGNFYCLVIDGQKKGRVVFCVQAEPGRNQRIRDVSPSFGMFLQGLLEERYCYAATA
jgi:hypothetical protein